MAVFSLLFIYINERLFFLFSLQKHIDADVVEEPCFVRTLTIATVIACSNRKYNHTIKYVEHI